MTEGHDTQLVLQASTLAKTGRHTEASGLCRQVLAGQPSHLPALLWLGYTSENQVESEDCIAKAYDLAPQHPSVLKAVDWYNTHFVDPTGAPQTTASASSAEPASDKSAPDKMQQAIGEPVKDHANFFMSQTGNMLIGSAAVMVFNAGFFFYYTFVRGLVFTPFGVPRVVYAVLTAGLAVIAAGFLVFAVLDVITPPIKASGFISERKRIKREVKERYGTSIEYHFELKFIPDNATETGQSYAILKLTEEQFQASEKSNRARVVYSRRLGSVRLYQPLRSVH